MPEGLSLRRVRRERSRPGRTWRPPRRRRGSPATCPSTARAGRASRASSRRRRKYGRDASASSLAGGIVISPRTSRIQLEETREVVRRDARLRRLARQVHLDERGNGQPLRRRFGPEGVAELTQLAHRLRLAALQVADEVPAEAVAVARVLRLEILRAVLAHDLHARGGERVELVHRDVLRRRDDGHRRPDLGLDPLVSLADLLRRHARALPGLRAACRRAGAKRTAPDGRRCRGRSGRRASRLRRAVRLRPSARDRASVP